MKSVRALLYKMLGQKRYLGFVSAVYIFLTRRGFFKNSAPELHFLQKIIKEGDVCIDIGANVGYYSTHLAALSGPKGMVHAVEPVPLFAEIFKKNTLHFSNIQLHNCALGGENKEIRMGTPVIDGVFRHGLTKVLEDQNNRTGQTYQVKMRVPDELFLNLERLDFIKCDVEGYEVQLIPYLTNTLMKFKPLIQMEITSRENREFMMRFLGWQGYEPYKLNGNGLVKLSEYEALEYQGGDFYFRAEN